MIEEDVISNLAGFTLLIMFITLVAIPFLFLVSFLSIYEIKLIFDWVNTL